MRNITLATALLLTLASAQAQCPDCTPDPDCSISPAFPTMCPLTPPDATAGQPYATVVTFWMPSSFTDPGTGITVGFQQMTITGVSGLPFGLHITYDHPTGVYSPQQQEHGCAHICGTPLLAGTYPITISILAAVSVSGFTLEVPQDFTLQLTVLPGSGGNAGFTYTPTSGCGSTAVELHALIDGSPSPTTHAWDLGDGTTAQGANPPAHVYEEPGEYVISLTTTIGGYVLEEVRLTSVNGNWCGDIEEPNLPIVGCQGSPDPYFVLTDGQGNTYTSSTVDDSFTATWSGLALPMNNPPYSISFYDEDVVSPDDLLGTYNLPANGAGTYNFNVAGGTTGNLTIGEQAQQEFIHTDTVIIFPMPDLELTGDSLGGQLCVAADPLANYIWFLNGDTMPAFNEACIPAFGAGLWQVEVTNQYGCTAMSNTVVICPEIDIIRNGPVLQISSGFLTYTWTYQGNPVGGNDQFLIIVGDGHYTVTATDANGCTVTASYDLSTVGIGEAALPAVQLAVFPVPNNGEFTVVATRVEGRTAEVRILDAVGRLVKAREVPVVNGSIRTEVSESLPQGSYLLHVAGTGMPLTARFVVR
ncbi:MAG TPA: PKD domain-containing protein [Flavobacteriales bacterium]|nr:PKD domain-containing protein [Flavobacteriales bacterium]